MTGNIERKRPARSQAVRGATVAVALAILASGCALPHPHFRGAVPTMPPLSQTSIVYDRTGGSSSDCMPARTGRSFRSTTFPATSSTP
jgi:hypothetical protein